MSNGTLRYAPEVWRDVKRDVINEPKTLAIAEEAAQSGAAEAAELAGGLGEDAGGDASLFGAWELDGGEAL